MLKRKSAVSPNSANECLSIKLGSGYAAYALASAAGQGGKIVKAGRVKLREGDGFSASKIKEILKNEGVWKSNAPAALVLGPEIGSLVHMDAPPKGLERAESVKALRWQMGDKVDFQVAEGEFEGCAIKEAEDGGLLRPLWWMYGVARGDLKKRLLCLDGAGLDCSVAVPEMAAFAGYAGKHSADRVSVFLSVGSEYSSMSFCSAQCGLLFHKQLEWTRKDFGDKEKLERLVLDFQRNLDFFDRRLSSIATGKTVLAGFDDEMEKNWRLACEGFIGLSQERLDYSREIENFASVAGDDELARLALAALSQARGDASPLNIFRPFAAQAKQGQRRKGLIAGAAAAAALALCGFYAYTESFYEHAIKEAASREEQAKKQQEQINSVMAKQAGPDKELSQALARLEAEVGKRKALLGRAAVDKDSSLRAQSAMEQLEQAISASSGAWIEELAIASSSSGCAGCRVSGMALGKKNADEAARLIAGAAWAGEAKLSKVAVEKAANGAGWHFKIEQKGSGK